MRTRLPRTLIVDSDPDALLSLQRVLEEAGIDTTATRDEKEAWQLLETIPFDLILIGDHPPELDAGAIIDDLSFRGTCPRVLILRTSINRKDVSHFRRLGAMDVLLKQDLVAVLGGVNKALGPVRSDPKFVETTLNESRSWRAA